MNDHGTHVAGTIAAKANNGVGVAGVSFNSQLAICQALNAAGSGTTAGVANCITYLAGKGVKIISMSLGGGASTTLQSAVTNACNNGTGTLIIAAAGNDGDATLNYPAAYAGGRLRRRDRLQRRARLVLQRQRRRRDRRGGRQRPLDQARRRLRRVLRHLDGDARTSPASPR